MSEKQKRRLGLPQSGKRRTGRLIMCDVAIFLAVVVLLLVVYEGRDDLTSFGMFCQALLAFVLIFLARWVGGIYRQIWRYGGIQSYIRLLGTDAVAFVPFAVLGRALPIQNITFARALSISSLNLLAALAIRMAYRYAYKCGNTDSILGKMMLWFLQRFAGLSGNRKNEGQQIKIAILGAGRVGVSLAEELFNNSAAVYTPRCFIDSSPEKVGKEIQGIPVLSDEEATREKLAGFEIQEIVFAIPNTDSDTKKRLYDRYKNYGCKIKVYDFPVMQVAGGKRHLREFDVEELLFRKQQYVVDDRTRAYYAGKVILITGGGGSIGSELCRQIAGMQPKRIVILDIYENGAYDVQQELRMKYKDVLDVQVEIASITNKEALRRVFRMHTPQIVINAAAHKHVPLMEHNCIEAIENNIFGCQNVVELCEEFACERFLMVSTDKAVNPTNVMGATKRMCEMLVQSAAAVGKVKYSATRFGNVLGSAGSVIPLFRRQIAAGGPVTLTDKRIIRYFMTIPEASQLVLQSGAMADNGELFVLDMGKPVKILELAENMIRLSGAQGIEIVETGLRPGEKLYEELLVDCESLDKTDNSLIFIEKDTPVDRELIAERMQLLKKACESGDESEARYALHKAVPTYRHPEFVNSRFDSDKVEEQLQNTAHCAKS